MSSLPGSGLSQVGADSASGGVPAAPAVSAGVLAIATFVWRQLRLQRTGTGCSTCAPFASAASRSG